MYATVKFKNTSNQEDYLSFESLQSLVEWAILNEHTKTITDKSINVSSNDDLLVIPGLLSIEFNGQLTASGFKNYLSEFSGTNPSEGASEVPAYAVSEFPSPSSLIDYQEVLGVVDIRRKRLGLFGWLLILLFGEDTLNIRLNSKITELKRELKNLQQSDGSEQITDLMKKVNSARKSLEAIAEKGSFEKNEVELLIKDLNKFPTEIKSVHDSSQIANVIKSLNTIYLSQPKEHAVLSTLRKGFNSNQLLRWFKFALLEVLPAAGSVAIGFFLALQFLEKGIKLAENDKSEMVAMATVVSGAGIFVISVFIARAITSITSGQTQRSRLTSEENTGLMSRLRNLF